MEGSGLIAINIGYVARYVPIIHRPNTRQHRAGDRLSSRREVAGSDLVAVAKQLPSRTTGVAVVRLRPHSRAHGPTFSRVDARPFFGLGDGKADRMPTRSAT
jgi:hypothetical protein